MRRRLRPLVWLFVVYAVVCLAAAIFLAHATVQASHRPLPPSAESHMAQIAAGLHSQIEDVQISAFDQAVLRAWYIRPQHSNGDVVILLHGLGDNRLGMQGYAEMLLNHGYSVLMPDARAHGISGGVHPTYGLLERDDLRRWFEWIETEYRPGGFGESMGAAQLLQALDAEPNFCAVAAESPFSSFREIGYDRMGQQFHAHTHVPVLLIHGQIDSNIPVRHSRRIKLANPQVVLWEVPGADHCGAISVAPVEFEHRILTWFAAHQSRANSYARTCVQSSMQMEAHLDAETLERVEEQRGLLLRLYQADFAQDPTSRATQSSRSNMIALRHTIGQIYGEAAALEATGALGLDAATRGEVFTRPGFGSEQKVESFKLNQ